LGGFLASVGSASQALGETEEKRREAELPIAQMRTQLAQSKILTGANKTQADEYENGVQVASPITVRHYMPSTSLRHSRMPSRRINTGHIRTTLTTDAIQMKQAKGLPLSKAEQEFAPTCHHNCHCAKRLNHCCRWQACGSRRAFGHIQCTRWYVRPALQN
jgi:hypothetical protein